MTNQLYFLPMPKPHRVFILAYEGCQLLDVTGPAAVFGAANEASGRSVYDLQIVSPDGAAVASNAGVAIESRRIGGQPDTLLVAGGSLGLRTVMARQDVRRWLRKVAPRARRYGSVCTGAFVLAAAGLLDGKRVATHWASCDRLADRFPALTVDADSLYVVDGKVWTSAGVTTGIDMALALVEADLGAATANLIARHFVLYARRPGYQSQFSPLLQAQTAAEAPFAALIDWMQAHLDQPLDVPALASSAAMSAGHFSRSFKAAFGEGPYSYLMTRRIERAKALLRRGDISVTDACFAVGCTSLGSFSARFTELVGESPSAYRARSHSAAADIPDCVLKVMTKPIRNQEAAPAQRT